MSPELLDPESFDLKDGRPTHESDCYALGMVMYEVLSGQIPFTKENGPAVIRKVLEGKRPERPPTLFTGGLWEMLELCWKHRPQDRPSLKTLLQFLEGGMQASRSPSVSATNEGVAADDLPDPTVTGPATVFMPASCNTLDPPSTVRFRPRTPPSLTLTREPQQKEMSTGVRPSSIDDLAAFTTRLDGLRVDQSPDDLSNVLRAAFKERRLYRRYISSLVGGTEREKALLEVFDKVCSAMYNGHMGLHSARMHCTGPPDRQI